MASFLAFPLTFRVIFREFFWLLLELLRSIIIALTSSFYFHTYARIFIACVSFVSSNSEENSENVIRSNVTYSYSGLCNLSSLFLPCIFANLVWSLGKPMMFHEVVLGTSRNRWTPVLKRFVLVFDALKQVSVFHSKTRCTLFPGWRLTTR